jgi:hypothetical protein
MEHEILLKMEAAIDVMQRYVTDGPRIDGCIRVA